MLWVRLCFAPCGVLARQPVLNDLALELALLKQALATVDIVEHIVYANVSLIELKARLPFRHWAYNGRTKAIDIRLKMLRKAKAVGILNLKPTGSDDMISDILTKQLPAKDFWRHAHTIQNCARVEGE
ncbi:hypothetical protein NFJ02_32g82370 [Pycnococcus provasolii]